MPQMRSNFENKVFLLNESVLLGLLHTKRNQRLSNIAKTSHFFQKHMISKEKTAIESIGMLSISIGILSISFAVKPNHD
jgi:hypothetical protein